MRALWKPVIGLAAAIFSMSAVAGAPSKQDAFLTTTIADIGRPYTVIDGTCVTAPYPPITVTDGFVQTLNSAMKQAVEIGKKLGADAFVGMNVSWESPTNTGLKGRVLVCGTYVRFK